MGVVRSAGDFDKVDFFRIGQSFLDLILIGFKENAVLGSPDYLHRAGDGGKSFSVVLVEQSAENVCPYMVRKLFGMEINSFAEVFVLVGAGGPVANEIIGQRAGFIITVNAEIIGSVAVIAPGKSFVVVNLRTGSDKGDGFYSFRMGDCDFLRYESSKAVSGDVDRLGNAHTLSMKLIMSAQCSATV